MPSSLNFSGKVEPNFSGYPALSCKTTYKSRSFFYDTDKAEKVAQMVTHINGKIRMNYV